MNEQMEFPETFEGFAKEYGFKDDKEIYTNGSDLIPIFRVKQWLEYDNKLRRIETDTAYECGKHANKWIPVSEKLPEEGKEVLTCSNGGFIEIQSFEDSYDGYWENQKGDWTDLEEITAWMPLPKPYEPQESEEI